MPEPMNVIQKVETSQPIPYAAGLAVGLLVALAILDAFFGVHF